eukprot:g19196.t1
MTRIFASCTDLNPGGVRLLDEPVSFGALASESGCPNAPTAFEEAELFFVMNEAPYVFVQFFQIVQNGTVGTVPPILGQPFLRTYRVDILNSVQPPVASIAGIAFALAPENISMVDLRFISRHDAQRRWVPPSASRLFFSEANVKNFVQGSLALATHQQRRPKVQWQMIKLPKVHHASAFLNSGSDAGEPVVDDDMIFEAIDDIMAVNVPDSIDRDDIEMSEEERKKARQLFEFMHREHRKLGHSPALELLYQGDALKALKKARSLCRQCAQFDDVDIIRRQGSLQQFAYGKNQKWVIDLVFTRLGKIVKLVDLCTRLRVYELHDPTDLDGGQTGTAIKCFERAKRVCGGVCSDLYFDIGSEFVSECFTKVVEGSNARWHAIGFEAPHRIAGLESTNGDDKRRLNKLVTPPFEPQFETFIWSLAMHRADEELFNHNWQDFVEFLVKEKSNSDTHPEEFALKTVICQEMEFQANSVPMLNTTVSPYSCHFGTFYRGVRDWELLLVEEDNSKRTEKNLQIDQLISRNAEIQHVCRTIVLEKDIELLQRRLEVQSRVFARGKKAETYTVGQFVYVRRKGQGKFRRWIAGQVEGLNAEDQTVSVNVGGSTKRYEYKDVAVLKPLENDDIEYEFYPDPRKREAVVAREEESSDDAEEEVEREVQRKRIRTLPQSSDSNMSLLTYSTADLPSDWKSSSTSEFELPAGDRLFSDGFLHPLALSTLNRSKTEMELVVSKGKTYLTAPFDKPDGNLLRSLDFSVLPEIERIAREDKREGGRLNYRLMSGPNEVVFLASQMMNGKPIVDKINQKDNRKDLQCVAVEAVVFKSKAAGPVAPGQRAFVRWGGTNKPRFQTESDAKQDEEGTWVLLIYYETCEAAHAALEKYTDGTKSSAIVVEARDAEELGFVQYIYPALAEELRGGGLFFHLRLCLIFQTFDLGSFSFLTEGRRDVYIGRELTVVPFLFDQATVRASLDENKSLFEQSKIQLPEHAVITPSDAELRLVKERVGFEPLTEPTEYPETEKVPHCPLTIAEQYTMAHPVVYYMGQTIYAQKIKPLLEEEVTDYFRCREKAAGDRWKLRNIKSPFKGRLGELIWLKFCAIAAVSVSELASVAHAAEQCSSFDEVSGFVEDLNGCIGVSKRPQANLQRVYFLGRLLEHFALGAADAGKERIGGTPFLAGRQVPRINVISRFQPKPQRKFPSSTAIEVLAQKVCSSELIFLVQLLLDLFLCGIGRALGQISDSRNSLQEPRERNIRPDFQALSGLQRAKLLRLYHGPGKVMWPDGLTKCFRDGQMYLLHLACNFGLIDAQMMSIVQRHIEEILYNEDQKHEMLVTDLVKQMEDSNADATPVDDNAEEGDGEIPILDAPGASTTSAALDGMALFADRSASSSSYPYADVPVGVTLRYPNKNGEGHWEETARLLIRHHLRRRYAKMTPTNVDTVSPASAHQHLSHRRTTGCVYTNSAAQRIRTKVDDSWMDPAVAHGPLYKDRMPWMGTTTYYKMRASFGKKLVLREPLEQKAASSTDNWRINRDRLKTQESKLGIIIYEVEYKRLWADYSDSSTQYE